MEPCKKENITDALAAIAGNVIHPRFGEPFRSAFAAQYPKGSDEEITAAAYICSLFLSAILEGFSTERLHTFVHYAKDNCSRFTFDCKMYSTLLSAISEESLEQVPLMDRSGGTVFTRCSRDSIMEAFDFYTNR